MRTRIRVHLNNFLALEFGDIGVWRHWSGSVDFGV